MCGIVGAIAPSIVDSEINIFNQLMYASAFRGTDSTGVVVVRGQNKKGLRYTLAKEVEHPAVFVHRHSSLWTNQKNNTTTHALIGHCRAATVGKVTKENAHPFDLKTIVGCHNGTVSLKTDKEQTDSEVLLSLIDQRGIDEAIKELDNLGAYALVWFDKIQHTYHAIRNWNRPLAFCRISSHVVLLASEGKMLDWIVDRSSYTLAYPITNLEPHTLYTWKVGDSNLVPEKREIKPPVRTYHSTTYTGGMYGHGGWGWENELDGTRKDEYDTDNSRVVPFRRETVVAGHPQLNRLPSDRSNEGLVAVWDPVIKEYGYHSWINPAWNTSDKNKFGHLQPNTPVAEKPEEKEEELFRDMDNKVYTDDEVWTLLGEGCAHCTRVPEFDDVIDDKNNLIISIWQNDVGGSQYLCPTCTSAGSAPHNRIN